MLGEFVITEEGVLVGSWSRGWKPVSRNGDRPLGFLRAMLGLDKPVTLDVRPARVNPKHWAQVEACAEACFASSEGMC